jgi:hypothetical protein
MKNLNEHSLSPKPRFKFGIKNLKQECQTLNHEVWYILVGIIILTYLNMEKN